ncbi:PREDICTED: taste receptor type 1 member 1-like [Nanorana parkeri]|uniref:taste receptor type 1 member 1-like n=1 Tax=Nanorana parkeri TaxID=125878 RepID=UPI0008541BDC|nr:PREDICTED: taste receptor type 1 member 1-like [Nanorana parkeri]
MAHCIRIVCILKMAVNKPRTHNVSVKNKYSVNLLYRNYADEVSVTVDVIVNTQAVQRHSSSTLNDAQSPGHLCLASDCGDVTYNTEFSSPGDFVLGGLFKVHDIEDVSTRSIPLIDVCHSSNVHLPQGLHDNAQQQYGSSVHRLLPWVMVEPYDGVKGTFISLRFHFLQAMRLAIEEINNSTILLPNITLGYEVFDTCSEAANIYGTLRMLSQCSQPYIKIQNNFTNYKPNIIALIGPYSSSFSFVTANIMSLLLVPEISYSASNKHLSLKQMYPSFFRTIPSDNLQVQIMLSLLKTFNWTWVAMVGSDDVYGRQGLQDLIALTTKNGICVPYYGIIPNTNDRTYIKKMVDNIVQTHVGVIVVFSAYNSAQILLEEVIKANITGRVWIGSEDWLVYPEIAALPNIQSIGTIFGVSVSEIYFPKLLDFETAYVSSFKSQDVSEYNCNQVCDKCRSFTLQNMSIPGQATMSASFNIYAAAYAIAHGLHGLLNCRSGQCSNGTYYPWQLLQHVKKVNFTLYNQSISFDANGDPAMGYDIVMWSWIRESPTFRVVGSYSKTTQRLQLNERLPWNTKNSTVPESFCSTECGKGERRVQTGSYVCCFNCFPCPAMTFLNTSDLYSCQPCGSDQWSPMRSDSCYNRTLEYLSWTDPLSLILLSVITLLILVITATATMFVMNLSTPVVKSAGGKMCLGMLLSLALSCLTLYFYFGKPEVVTCIVKQPIFALSFTVCFSCILVHVFQIVCIFKMSSLMPKLYDLWVKKNGSDIFIAVSTAIQVLISVVWIAVKPPRPTADYSTYPDQIILKCSETVSVGSIAEITYIGFLCMICFIFCYMGKDLPASYNEAKCISFSLLVYFFSWIAFFTTYIVYQGKYLAAVNVCAVLFSVLGILIGYFVPKCYIILFRPELNTTEHFQAAIQDYTKKQSAQE